LPYDGNPSARKTVGGSDPRRYFLFIIKKGGVKGNLRGESWWKNSSIALEEESGGK
jgi:hypothetical protein